MFRLAALMYTIAATTLSGSAIVVVLALGMMSWEAILIAAALGAVAAIPVAWAVARAITAKA